MFVNRAKRFKDFKIKFNLTELSLVENKHRSICGGFSLKKAGETLVLTVSLINKTNHCLD